VSSYLTLKNDLIIKAKNPDKKIRSEFGGVFVDAAEKYAL
jgi:hypothetical protein